MCSRVPTPVLRKKFSEVAKCFLNILGKSSDGESTSLVKSVWRLICLVFIISAALRENQSSRFSTRSHLNQSVQSQEQTRTLEFRILEEEKLYYLCSENKGADQLRSYYNCEADLLLCFRIGKKKKFSHDAAQIIYRCEQIYK